MSVSNMDGKRVTFSVTADTFATGVVQTQIMMREKKEDTFAISGFLILNEEDGSYKQIASWRLQHPARTNQGHLPGGYNRKDRLGNMD